MACMTHISLYVTIPHIETSLNSQNRREGNTIVGVKRKQKVTWKSVGGAGTHKGK